MKCSIPSCTLEDRRKETQVSFHQFPSTRIYGAMRKSWIELIRQLQANPNWEPTERSRVCSRHFNPGAIYDTATGRRLGGCPIPSLFLDKDMDFHIADSRDCNASNTCGNMEESADIFIHGVDPEIDINFSNSCKTETQSDDGQLHSVRVNHSERKRPLSSGQTQQEEVPNKKVRKIEQVAFSSNKGGKILPRNVSTKIAEIVKAAFERASRKPKITDLIITKISGGAPTLATTTVDDDSKVSVKPNTPPPSNNIVDIAQDQDPLSFDETNMEPPPMDMEKKGFHNDHTYCSYMFSACEFCQMDLISEEKLFSHFVSTHGAQPKAFKCLQCGKNFVSSILLRKHMELHKMEKSHPIICDICEDRFSSDLPFHLHLDQHTLIRNTFSVVKKSSSMGRCLYCTRKFNSYSALRQHELKAHRLELKYSCPENKCKEPFSHLYLLNAHKITHRPESITLNSFDSLLLFPCLVCKFKFNTVKALKYHLLIHLDFAERRTTLFPGIILKKNLYCKTCGRTFFDSKEKLDNHEKSFLQHAAKCELCPEYYFSSGLDFINHVIEKHEWKSTPHHSSHNNDGKENEKFYKCCKPNCKASFVTDYMYKRHLRFHHFEKCPLCELGISLKKHKKDPLEIKAKIKSHMMNHHFNKSTEKRWRCEICLLNCCSALTLAVHVRRQHSSQLLTFICNICDKAFMSQEHLDSHCKTHAFGAGDEELSPEKQIFECHCAKSFISVEKFSEHLNSTHIGENLHVCDSCSDGALSPTLFLNKEDLEAHVKKEHSSSTDDQHANHDGNNIATWSSMDFDALIDQRLNINNNNNNNIAKSSGCKEESPNNLTNFEEKP